MEKQANKVEPDWSYGCAGNNVKPGDECEDCLAQRKFFGYVLEDGEWVKK